MASEGMQHAKKVKEHKVGNNNQKSYVMEYYGLLLIDLCCVMWSYLLALYLRFGSVAALGDGNVHIVTIFCILLFCIIYNSLTEINKDFTIRGYYVEMIVVLKRNVIISIIWGCSLFLVQAAQDFSRLVFGFFVIVNLLLTYIMHLLFKKYIRIYYTREKNKTKVMLVTDNNHLEEVLDLLLQKAEYQYDITSVTVWDKNRKQQMIRNIPIAADASDMLDVARQMPLDEVLIYLPGEKREIIQQIIIDFEMMGIVCHYSIDMTDFNAKTRTLEEFAGFTVITYALNQIDYKHRMLKRGMDLAGGLIGLLITILFFPFVAAAIKLDSKGPVLFAQTRIGKNGRRFKMYKFRSMYADAEERKKELMKKNEMQGLMFKMENDPRITKVGRFLRKTSIDELPQFFNVLKGDMSLVGTRPPTVDEFERYSPYYRRRLCMTPGLTGLWQVNGRSNVEDFDDVVKYDLKYIDYWSLSLDIKILFQTIGVVLFRKGAR